MGYSYPYRNNSSKNPPITPVAPHPNIQYPISTLPVIPITSATVASSSATTTDASNPNNKYKTFPNVKRKRTAQACNACRRKRIKCDGKSPCTPCIQHKTESECCFAQPLKRGPRKGSTRVNLKERLHKVEELLLKLTSKQNLDDTNLELLTKTVTENAKAKINSKTPSAASTTTVPPVAPAKADTTATTTVNAGAANTTSSLLQQKMSTLSNRPSSVTPILPNPNTDPTSALLTTNPTLAAAAAASAANATAFNDNTSSLLNALQASASSSNSSLNSSSKDSENSVQNLAASILNQSLLNTLLLNQQQQATALKNTPPKSTAEALSALNALSQQQQQQQQLASNLTPANASQLLALASQNPINNTNIDLLNPQNQASLMALAALQSNKKLKDNLTALAAKGAVRSPNTNLNATSSSLPEANVPSPSSSPFNSGLPTMNPSPKSLLETSLPLSPSLSTLKNNKRKAKSSKRNSISNKKPATSLYKDSLAFNQENMIDLTNTNSPLNTTSSTDKLSSVNSMNSKIDEELLKKKMKSMDKNDIPYMTSNNSITIPSTWSNTNSQIPSSSSAITSSIYKTLLNNSKKEAEGNSGSAASSTPVSNLPFIKVSSQTPVEPPATSLFNSASTNSKNASNGMDVNLLKNGSYNLFDNKGVLNPAVAAVNGKIPIEKNNLNANKNGLNDGATNSQLKLQELIQNQFKQFTKNGVLNQELLASNPLYSQLLLNSKAAAASTTTADGSSTAANGSGTNFVNPASGLASNLASFNISNSLISPNTTAMNSLNSSFVPSTATGIDSMILPNSLNSYPLNTLNSTSSNGNEDDNVNKSNAIQTIAKLNGLTATNKTSPLISQNGLTIPSDNSALLISDNTKNINANVGLDFLNTINNANSLNTLNINNLYRSKLLSSMNPLNPLNPLNARQGLNDNNIFMYNINPELLQNYPFAMASKFGENGSLDGLFGNKSPLLSKNETEEKKPDYKGDLGVAFIDMKSSGGYIYFGNSSCVGLASNLISSEKKTAKFSFNELKNILASAVSNRKEDGSDSVTINSKIEDVTPITTKENFRKVLDLFFDNLHPIIPLFNRQAFTSLLDNDPDAPGYQLLLHCILAVVGKYIPKEELPKDLPSDISQLAFDWARNQLQKVFDIPSLPTVQALMILSTLAMSNPRSEMGYSTYTYTGTAVRMAHELGLHRDLMLRGQDHTLEEKNETRRAWVLLYILDRQSALMTGRPMIIDDSDWDIPPPTIDSNEVTDAEKASMEALSVRLELFEIVGEISRWSNAGKRKASQESDPIKKEEFVLLHQKKLTDWRNSLPEFLKWTDPPYLYTSDDSTTTTLNSLKPELNPTTTATTTAATVTSNLTTNPTNTTGISTTPNTTTTTTNGSGNGNTTNKLNFDIKMENPDKNDFTMESKSPSYSGLSKSPKDLVWTMFPLYLAAIYYRAQLALHVYSLTSNSINPTVIESKNICANSAIYLTNIIISMMAITPEPHPLCSFFLAQLPTTIMTCISVQLFIVKSNIWSAEERHTATKAILNNIQLLKISKVQPLATYLYAYAKWIVRKANIEIKESDLESIDAMNANTTSSNLKSIYSSIYSSTKLNQNIKNESIQNSLPSQPTNSVASSTSTTSTPTTNYINPAFLNDTDSIPSTVKGKTILNENELIDNKDIAMTNNIQDDTLLKNYIKNNDLFSTTNDFLDLIQEMNLGLQ